MDTVSSPRLHKVYETPGFYIVSSSIGDVAVRKGDFKTNVSHIYTIMRGCDARQREKDIRKMKQQMQDTHFEHVRGYMRIAGLYIPFHTAIDLCAQSSALVKVLLEFRSIYDQSGHERHVSGQVIE